MELLVKKQFVRAVGLVAQAQARAVLESIIGMLAGRPVKVQLFDSTSPRPILQASLSFLQRSLAQVVVSGIDAMEKHFEVLHGHASRGLPHLRVLLRRDTEGSGH